MIVKTFDQGWGPEWAVKQFETEILEKFLAPLQSTRIVVINNTWYTKEYHAQVIDELARIEFTHLILVSMIDYATFDLSWFESLNCNIVPVGYVRGPGEIDFWSMTFDKFYHPANIQAEIDTAYMCLNRKPHWHRRMLWQQLKNKNLLDQGIVSMGGERSIDNDLAQGFENLTPNFDSGEYGIVNDIVSLGNIKNWNRCFLNIVTETAWDINRTNFVSEKIYKPIVGCRPFLVYDPTGAVDWLTSRGFESYVKDFADISNLDLANPNNLADFLETLCEQPPAYWHYKYLALQEKIQYNKQRFNEYVQQQKQNIEKGIQCQV